MIEVLIISNQGMKIVEKYGCLLEKVGLYVFRPFFVKLAKSSNKVENQKKIQDQQEPCEPCEDYNICS